MSPHELTNRIWIILAVSCPLTYYLHSESNDLFILTGLLGAAAIIHAERQSEYHGWNDSVVLIAHCLAVLAIFVMAGTLSLLASFKLGLPTVFGIMVVFFVSFGSAMAAHNLVQSHYDKLRAKNE